MNSYERKKLMRGFKKGSSRFYFAYKHAGTGEVVLLKGPSLEYVSDLADDYRKKPKVAADVHVLEDEYVPVGGAGTKEVNSAALAAVRRDKPEWFEGGAE